MSDYEFKPKKYSFGGWDYIDYNKHTREICLRGHQPRLRIRSIHLPRNPDHRTKAFAGAEQ
jgi:hypothetical protein